MPHLHTVSIAIGVRVGSRHESDAENGISHFLEHMLFRGTAELPTAFEFNLAIESLGGTLQAATRTDFTTYELTLPPEHAEAGLAICAQLFGTPVLRNLELEKRIVREEILEGLDEDGRDVDPDDLAHAALFGAHPLGFKIAGGDSTLARFDERALRAWHARHYVARNASLAVAGAIDPSAIEAAIARSFGGIAGGEAQRPTPYARASRGPRLHYVESTGSQTDVRVVLPSVGEEHALETPTAMLARILDDGMSTRLFRTVVEDTGLAYETFGELDTYEDVGVFMIGASIEHAKTASLVSTVLGLLTDLRDGEIEARELEKARARALFDLRRLLDAGAAIAELLAADLLFQRQRTLEMLRERIERVTLEDVRAAARHTLRGDSLQVIAVGLLSEGIERETKRLVAGFR